MVQFQFTDDVTQGGCGQILDCRNRTFYTIGEQFCVGNLIEYNAVDLHGYVISSNNWLWFKINNLLF